MEKERDGREQVIKIKGYIIQKFKEKGKREWLVFVVGID